MTKRTNIDLQINSSISIQRKWNTHETFFPANSIIQLETRLDSVGINLVSRWNLRRKGRGHAVWKLRRRQLLVQAWRFIANTLVSNKVVADLLLFLEIRLVTTILVSALYSNEINLASNTIGEYKFFKR